VFPTSWCPPPGSTCPSPSSKVERTWSRTL
jgi:hypothetical protein